MHIYKHTYTHTYIYIYIYIYIVYAYTYSIHIYLFNKLHMYLFVTSYFFICSHTRSLFEPSVSSNISSSSSCRAGSTDIPDPLLPLLPIVHRPREGLQGQHTVVLTLAAECMFVLVVLLLHGHVWGVHKSTSLMSLSLLLQQCPCMSGSSNLYNFRDRRQVAVQLVSCWVLPPGLVQDCTKHSFVIAV